MSTPETTEVIDQPETAITIMTVEEMVRIAYADVDKQLDELRKDNDNAVFDYESPKGNKMARSHVAQFRKVKTAIENKRKSLKAESLEYGRKVDATAKTFSTQIEEMIAVHDEPLKAIEDKETARKQAIQEAIDNVCQKAMGITINSSAIAMQTAITELESIDILPGVFAERMAEATTLRDNDLADLKAGLAARQKHDAEQAELARLREEATKREQADREARIAAEAAAKAKAQAEADAQAKQIAAEAKARAERQAEREAAAKREADAQSATAAAERRAAEAEANAKAKVEREAQAKREADEKRAANAKHVESVMKSVIESINDATKSTGGNDVGIVVAQAIRDGRIPHVTINF